MPSHWKIRPAKALDFNFIYSTWVNSFLSDSSLGKSVRKGVFKAGYYPVLDALLERSEILVACLPEDEDIILGYLTYELPNVCHYAFVKDSFRKMGIAHDLLLHAFNAQETEVLIHTHQTKCLKEILNRRPSFEYNPFLLFKRSEEE